mgnify:FL=1
MFFEMFDEQGRYVIRNYQRGPTFSSFLPGIAGPLEVPVWCYYNNRGQGVCSFGVNDKDHAILEFAPARQAYRDVARTGFRTFCKVNGAYRELFTQNCDMHIGMGELEITCEQSGLRASAAYFGVPGERTAALARVLTVANAGAEPVPLELLDGLPELIPYGVSHENLKEMNNLAQAWMRVEDADNGMACFRVRASMEDTAQVSRVEGCNFCLAWDEGGTLLRPLVQPELVFGTDTSLAAAEGFAAATLADLRTASQQPENRFPCCFLPKQTVLGSGEELRIFSLYGQAEGKDRVVALAGRVSGGAWFEEKRRQAAALVEKLCAPISCRTSDPVFDAYCRQTYLDNALRGGAPMFFEDGGKCVPFYLYSRKHGDPEREYNAFSLGGEYFAQGNENFRDVNQNRRCDVRFAPRLGAENIYTFFDLIQADGYNPLVLNASTYTLRPEALADILARVPEGRQAEAAQLLAKPFTPGALAMAAEDWGMEEGDALSLTAAAVCAADHEPNADFKEGYWCDHWTYNLDLIESYLAVYPEGEEELLFGERRCRWYESRAVVKPRAKRYHMTPKGLRQYGALDEEAKAGIARKWARAGDGQAVSTLMEKLLLVCAVKTATLDAGGMGIEMEGGKPGWYDALNGLPGLLGSSMAESCELARLLAFTRRALGRRPGQVELYEEIAALIERVAEVLGAEPDAFLRWDRLNAAKERYRARTDFGFSGARRSVGREALAEALGRMEEAVRAGIRAAVALEGGICPTYFTFEAQGINDGPEGPMPAGLVPHPLPLFLEGPVRWLKLDAPRAEKAELARRVRESALYDKELGMYKVNESLAGVSFEAGRAVAFSPGWLENESIWLHMEYKYLLELLKSGLYEEFAQAFHAAAVPFLDPERYGRSPLENVSFLASSANPDPERWGRGFVARLSGSTAEFLQMWQIMFFGPAPFRWEDGELRLALEPFLPGYLMPGDGVIRAAFLGSVQVTYHVPGCAALIPGKTGPVRWTLTGRDGGRIAIHGPRLSGAEARMVRDGEISAIDIEMEELK